MTSLLCRTRLDIRVRQSTGVVILLSKRLSSSGVRPLLPRTQPSSSATKSTTTRQSHDLAAPKLFTVAEDAESSISPWTPPSLGGGNGSRAPLGRQESTPHGAISPSDASKTMPRKQVGALETTAANVVHVDNEVPPPKDCPGDQKAAASTLSNTSQRIYPVGLVQPAITDMNTVAPVFAPIDTTEVPFWQKIPLWKDVTKAEFLSYQWSKSNTVESGPRLHRFLGAVLPDTVPPASGAGHDNVHQPQSREEYMADVFEGALSATMSIRMTPYVLSRIDWSDPRNDPIARQFLPLKTAMIKDHPKLQLDSLHEEADSPVKGLVHRYPDRVLFLPVSVCPVYCSFCTRSYAVGGPTTSVPKKHSLAPIQKRWDAAMEYIEKTREVQDVVVSGGDSYYLSPDQLRHIGKRLLDMASIRRIRFASRGLAAAPGRFLDPQDGWADALIEVARHGRAAGKEVALHTHFNHPDEMSWVTVRAARRLFAAGVRVRNQSVLLRGVNDSVQAMGRLLRQLADNHIEPYYVYQCDMVRRVEHLRTPLQASLDLETALRGFTTGFQMPDFVVDLPGGGGKRLASTFASYDRTTGRSVFSAQAVKGADAVYEYWDPEHSLVKVGGL